MKRDELFERRLLAQVHAGGSFSAAARSLGVTVSTVTRAIQRVEEDLGVRLFARAARGLRATEAGALYLAHVARVLHGEAEARAALQEIAAGSSGTLRLTVPVFVAEHLLPAAVVAFTAAHPDVRLEVHASDDVVDLAASGFDLAVRAGPLPDSSLRARKLLEYPIALAAAPQLVRRLPPLTHPSQLAGWPLLGYGRALPLRWAFRHGGERVALELAPLVRSNNLDLLISLTTAGVGAALLPALALPPTTARAPALVRLLEPWCERLRATLYAVYPADPGKARSRAAFLAALSAAARERFGVAL